MPPKALKFRPLVDGPLSQLLSRYDDRRRSGFITHLDKSPISRKRNAFVKGLVMNLGLLAVIGWLISATIIRDIFSPFKTPVLTAFCATQDLIIAWAIYSMLITTSIPFFLRECRLRFRCGFRPIEVVFRKPPVLERSLPEDEIIGQYRRFVARSMDPHLIYSSFWTFLTSELWVSEHLAIMEAHQRIDLGEIDEARLESAIWRQENGAWSVCEMSKMDNMV